MTSLLIDICADVPEYFDHNNQDPQHYTSHKPCSVEGSGLL